MYVQLFCGYDECCRSTEIHTINYIYTNGTNSLSHATIFSEDAGILTADIGGYNSEVFTIYCNSTDACYINCQSKFACDNLYLYCQGRCYVSCWTPNVNTTSNNTDCVNIVYQSNQTSYQTTIVTTNVPIVETEPATSMVNVILTTFSTTEDSAQMISVYYNLVLMTMIVCML